MLALASRILALLGLAQRLLSARVSAGRGAGVFRSGWPRPTCPHTDRRRRARGRWPEQQAQASAGRRRPLGSARLQEDTAAGRACACGRGEFVLLWMACPVGLGALAGC